MVEISKVQTGSIAAEIGISAGDKLLKINGQDVRDYIDFQYAIAADYFILTIEKKDGQLWEYEIEKNPDENLGILLDGIIYDSLKICKNNCLFCFVQQQPEGLRKTLCIKDDDYRFSFLHGSFITLTNLDDSEFERIVKLNLSPLYISVHTSNPALRIEMMKNPNAGKIMEQLRFLATKGINFHTQIVLCPGHNDGEELDNTINDLVSLFPQILSIGVVPVGLTDFRDNLKELKRYDSDGAIKIVKQIKEWQDKLKDKYGRNFLYISDEFYFLAGDDLPDYDHYNNFPQIENGIGLTRLFWNDFSRLELPDRVNQKDVGIVTGILGEKAIKPIVNTLSNIKDLNISILTIENDFFGKSVTVTGLLTGHDIIKGLHKIENKPKIVLLPAIIFNNQGFLLDELSLDDIKKEFPDIKFYITESMEDVLEVLKNG